MLFMSFLFIGIGLAMAQKKVTGIVISAEDNEPVVGASILVKGTTVGTVTNMDGKFELQNVPNSAKTLIISYIGMKSQELAIKSSLRVVLEPDAQTLDDVIVVAYGTQKNHHLQVQLLLLELKRLRNV